MTLKWTPNWLTAFVAAALALTLAPAQARCEGWSVIEMLLGWAQPQPVKPCPGMPLCPEGTCLGAITMPCCPVCPCPTGESPAQQPGVTCATGTSSCFPTQRVIIGERIMSLQNSAAMITAGGDHFRLLFPPSSGGWNVGCANEFFEAVPVCNNVFAFAQTPCPGCPASVPQTSVCPVFQPICGSGQCGSNACECPVLRALTERKMSISFENRSLASCLHAIKEFLGDINISEDQCAIDRAGVRLDRPVTLNATDASLECCLQMLLKSFNLAYAVDHVSGNITITTPEQCGKQCVGQYVPSPCPGTPDCGSCIPSPEILMRGFVIQSSASQLQQPTCHDNLGTWIGGIVGKTESSPCFQECPTGTFRTILVNPIPMHYYGSYVVPMINPIRVNGLTVFDAQQAVPAGYVEAPRPVVQPQAGRIMVTIQKVDPCVCEEGAGCVPAERQMEEMRRISYEQQRSVQELNNAVRELSQEIRSLRQEIQELRSGNSQTKPPFGATTQQIRFIYMKPDATPNVIHPFRPW
jgi:hypothetical protein